MSDLLIAKAYLYDIVANSIIKQCSDCDSQIASISVIKNKDKILKELSDLKSYDDRIEFAEKHFKLLGTGSSRAIFQVSDQVILKVAISKKGVAQILTESKPTMQCPCTNHILAFDANGKWSISNFNDNVSEKEFKQLTGMGFKAYCSGLYYKLNNESDERKPKDWDDMQKNSFFKCVSELAFQNSLLAGDLMKINSYGVIDGKVLLRDAGLSREIWKKYYNNDGSSSTSSSS